MTRSTSAVAVCCSAIRTARGALLLGLNNRTFSIAMTAWSAKVVDQLDLLLGKRVDLIARSVEDADGRSLTQERHAKMRSVSECLADSRVARYSGSASTSGM